MRRIAYLAAMSVLPLVLLLPALWLVVPLGHPGSVSHPEAGPLPCCTYDS